MDEDSERKAFISRIGTFFLLLGVLVVILFIASDMGEETYFRYFFIGAVLLVAGLILKRMAAPPPTVSKRFEWIRKSRQKQREAKIKKETPKNDQNKKK